MIKRTYLETYYGLSIFFYPEEALFKALDDDNTVIKSHKSYSQLRKEVKAALKFKYINISALDCNGKLVAFGCMEKDGEVYDLTSGVKRSYLLDSLYKDDPQAKKLFAELETLKNREKEIRSELQNYKFEL